MHVFFNATVAAMGAGITVPSRLLPAFLEVDGGENEYTVVCPDAVRARLDPKSPRVRFISTNWGGVSLPRHASEQLALPLRAALARADVLLSPFNLAVLLAPVPQVLMFQNVAPYTPEVVKSYRSRRRLMILRELGVLSAKRANRVVFVAKSQQATILPWLKIPEARTSVIYTGWDRAFTPAAKADAGPLLQRLGVGPRYLLSVSQFYRYKNLVELVRGFALALRDLPADMQLVLAGAEPEPDYSAEVRAAIVESGVEGRVKILGQVPYEQLPSLYAAASLFLFTSICESFPNILLEALAAGVPVLSSDRCSMPEIAGDAAVYFDPHSPEQIARRIVEVWSHPTEQERLRAAGVAQAQKYSWNRTGEELLRVLSAAAGRPVRRNGGP